MRLIVVTLALFGLLVGPAWGQDVTKPPEIPPKMSAEEEVLQLRIQNLNLEFSLLQKRLPEIQAEFKKAQDDLKAYQEKNQPKKAVEEKKK